MKYLFLLLSLASSASGQELRTLERGPSHSLVESTRKVILADGSEGSLTNRYVQLGDGLNFWDGEAYRPSKAEFRLEQGRAIADQLQQKITLAGNLNQVGSVRLETSKGRVFLSTPLMLVMRDPGSGETLLLGRLQDTEGRLTAPETVVYPKAFGEDIAASIRYTCRLGGLEQDIIIEEPIDPRSFGFPEGATIEMWTETFGWTEPQQRATAPAGTLEDVRLAFDEFEIGQGKAFALGDRSAEVPIAKRYGEVSGRTFLVEIVECQALKPLLEKLPQRAAVEPRTRKRVGHPRELLAGMSRPQSRGLMASIQHGPAGARSGVVLDYATLSTPQSNFTFEGDQVYLVTSTVSFAQTTTLVGGTVIKLDTLGSLNIQGPLICQTSPYRQAIITSRLDTSVGEFISAGPPTSKIYGSPTLNLSPTVFTAYALHDLAIRWANEAVRIDNASLVVTNLQVVSCNKAFYKGSTATTLQLKNVLIDDVGTVLDGSSIGGNAGQHLTCHRVSNFMQGTVPAIALENSLLISVTNTAGKYSGTSVKIQLDDTGVFGFQAGVGRHYLTGNSPFRNAGSAIVDPQFLAELRQRTTYAPTSLSGATASGLALGPTVPRDQGLLDYGYHYAVVDYILTDFAPSGALTLTNGVVVAGAGSSAIRLGNTYALNSEGSPTRLNRVVWCNAVQEQPISAGASSGSRSLIEVYNNYQPAPAIRLRFTETSLGAGEGNIVLFGNAPGTYNPSSFEVRDCQIRGGGWSLSPTVPGISVQLVNNLFEYNALQFHQGTVYALVDYNLDMRNCFFRKGMLGLTKNTGVTTWNFKANFFDLAALYNTLGSGVSLGASFNGYRTGATRLPGEVSYQEVTTFNHLVERLGEYYYTLPGAVDTLNDLVDTGDVTSSVAGLFHHTVNGVTQAKDAGVKVDIGWHYIALNPSGLPVDTDGDGVPDYVEDRNGDSIKQANETGWSSPSTDFNSADGLGVSSTLIYTLLR